MSLWARARAEFIAPLLRRHGDRLVPALLARRSARLEWMRRLAQWWREHGGRAELASTREGLWAAVMPRHWQGDYLEFGVSTGESLSWWSTHTAPQVRLFGFDTFTGLPEEWGGQAAGTYSAHGRLPEIDDQRVRYVVGRFDETVDPFLAATTLRHPLVVHLDADLYRSTFDVLTALSPTLRTGDVVIFDELLDVGTADHEFRALVEATAQTGLRLDVVGAVRRGRQAAFRVH